jgi:hypothetical protein
LISNSQIGETNCLGSATNCTLRHVWIDGSGGMLTAEGTSRGFYDDCNITTDVYGKGSALLRFTNSLFRSNNDKTGGLHVAANEQSVILVQNTPLPISVDYRIGYVLSSSTTGAIVIARILTPSPTSMSSYTLSCDGLPRTISITFHARICCTSTQTGNWSIVAQHASSSPLGNVR